MKHVLPSCVIDVAEDGEAALCAILERFAYNLVLTDLHMPKDIYGLETARRVRKISPLKPRICALTADTLAG